MRYTRAMKFAAIADIHGNSLALEAVLADIRNQGISEIVNLGDFFSSPLDAEGTAELLRGIDAVSIRGNHDRWLIEQAPEEMGKSDRIAHDQLGSDTLDWIRELPATLIWRDEIFLCHGTPEDDNTYWLEQVTQDGRVRSAALKDIEARAQGIEQKLILCAHTHLPRTVALADGRLIVNPGSVGCPAYIDIEPAPHKVQAGNPNACYAILEQQGEDWSVTHRHVPYDHLEMSRIAMERGSPSWAEGLATGWISNETFAAIAGR
ncbi:metallophosphatase family protein [Nisaea acidiphila]|uniref:Metallophosphatase family protein n=1 Tax=Nisaea acidiphila TaxID=1862145 RepID=A0A9J7AMQ5_9PROT|nr:metallophosphoesterase family protein [Nisaea acidiphila]UUX48736.1 metallophosphatase family protein [Nisaea acidiphila]